jgi:hypothetical protein
VAGVALAILGGYLSAHQTVLPLVLAGLGGALAGAGAAAAVRGWELRVFTPEGSAAWLQVEALRQFLPQSPPTAVDEMIAFRRLGRYTAWAVALGEAQRWSQLTSHVLVPAGSPYDTRSLLYAGYAPAFVTHCSTSSMGVVCIERRRRRWWCQRRRGRRRWGRWPLVSQDLRPPRP